MKFLAVFHKSCRTISSLGHGGNLSALSFMCFASVASAQILDFSISYFWGNRELETIHLFSQGFWRVLLFNQGHGGVQCGGLSCNPKIWN